MDWIFAVSNPEAWHYLDEEKNSENVNNVQNIADMTSDYLVRESWEDGNKILKQGTDKIKFEVKTVNVSEIQQNDDWSKISLKIHENEKLKETKVVLKSFENLGCIINGQRSCEIPNEKKKNQVWWSFEKVYLRQNLEAGQFPGRWSRCVWEQC